MSTATCVVLLRPCCASTLKTARCALGRGPSLAAASDVAAVSTTTFGGPAAGATRVVFNVGGGAVRAGAIEATRPLSIVVRT